jgi:hypothetical protein
MAYGNNKFKDPAYLLNLPPDEREAWTKFWSEVRELAHVAATPIKVGPCRDTSEERS